MLPKVLNPALCVLIFLHHVTSQDACADIDTQACIQMHNSQSDLCMTSLADSACKQFCGKCPTSTTQMMTTTTVIMTTTAVQCEDLSTSACQLMHKSRPDLCSDPAISDSACKRYCGKCPVECYTCSSLVKDMSECNATKTCELNEDCYMMEIFDFDQSHGFRGGCMSKDLCIPTAGGQETLIGRSSSMVHTKCCDTDRCNSQPIVTTEKPTTTTQAHHYFCTDHYSDCHQRKSYYCALHETRCPRTCGLC